MGYEIFCTFCGLMYTSPKIMHNFQPPFTQPKKRWTTWKYQKNIDCFEKFKKTIKSVDTKWMTDVIVIDKNGKKVGNADAGGSYNDEVYAGNRVFNVVFFDENTAEKGLLVHRSCYKKIKKISKSNENLFETYKHFIPILYNSNKHMIAVFGKKRIAHWWQDPIFTTNGKTFLLNKKNLSISSNYPENVYYRIHKLMDSRKSPIQSATEYKVGFKLVGMDGNVYVIKKFGNIKKWILLKI